MENVFTPREYGTNKRLRFNRDDVEILDGNLNQRGLGLKAIVRINNETYKVLGRSCGVPNCQCDAVIKKS
jgi:hypothetical protein